MISESPCVNSNPCQNGGKCYVSKWADQYYFCSCEGGWYGKNCTQGIFIHVHFTAVITEHVYLENIRHYEMMHVSLVMLRYWKIFHVNF